MSASSSVEAVDVNTISPATTKIGVIGAGWLGDTVGSLWVKAGYKVKFSSRHPEELQTLANRLGDNATVGTPAEAVKFADVILVAVPYSAVPQVAKDFAADLDGKIILDATNARADTSALTDETIANGVGVTSAKYFAGSHLVRAFSAVDATAIEASFNRPMPHKLGVPLASDDDIAMQVAIKLVHDAGSIPVVVGNLKQGRVFERGGDGFRANTTAEQLRSRLGLPASAIK
ncbi:NADPH-dependent F420 reductase [Shewanella sp.]|uniref:NADPH-dependent F420 reductase n=1 Tax=Shewanella sp. TaxID=50422 RepID=UPI003A9858F3